MCQIIKAMGKSKMTFQKRIDPKPKQQKQLKNLFKFGYSKYRISKTMGISLHLVGSWIKRLGIKKTGACNWCGKIRTGKSIGTRWLCKQCDKNKCKHCKVLLSKTRIDMNGIKYGDFYSDHSEYCKNCWNELSIK